MTDEFVRALVVESDLVVGVATTTGVCARAQRQHDLAATSAVALGRLMTGTVLTGLLPQSGAAVSLQILTNGRIRQVFADITDSGHVRGYIRPPDLGIPPLSETQRLGRRTLAHAMGDGILSMIRTADADPCVQSSIELLTGEIDEDLEDFFGRSDQVASAVALDVLLDADDRVRAAGGVLVQAQPSADLQRLEATRAAIADGGFAEMLAETSDARELLRRLFATAKEIDATPLEWKCRCSQERVVTSLRVIDVSELAEMVAKGDEVEVTCDFCAARYKVTPREIEEVYTAIIKAQV
ncbi:MAG: hypothetical protein A2289_04270 [Deltaproteobacteria bacterium RIFOXYA12_FULL_58_15]|nr:MAG: hypothetical protein A2289_04270 [Deltaproteobacteria bacterium RIFOXYA12_FULL_58_15]